ncbi:endothelin-converting enzyme homolog [Galendromus occidentalis]|uniref:Endothelin-converting enzyme homolog n=1 Tax=Galendromus occidentalis TaxID=34638 RepID=A0AAJ6QU26_9ACAR|nr:endothelin-converting enzyme homolog [Galendromus occidentalis]
MKVYSNLNSNSSLDDIVQLQRALESIPDAPFFSAVEASMSRISIASLQAELPFLNWLHFFDSAFSQVDIEVDQDTEILVEDLDGFKTLSDILLQYMGTEEGRATLSTHIGFQMIVDFSSVALPMNNEDLDKNSVDQMCLEATKIMLPLAVSAIYVREFVDRGSIAQVRTLAELIKFNFVETIGNVQWMDPESHGATLDKIENIRFMLGYEASILDPEQVDSEYADLSFEDSGFFEMNLQGRLFRRETSCRKMIAPPYLEDIGEEISPAESNAFYSVSRNTVAIPAAYMQAPRYSIFYPRFYQFGLMGFTIAHELFHSLDNIGRQYDIDGNVRQWWENSTIETFEERLECFVDQYSNYTIDGMRVKGSDTLGENLADFGGVKLAFQAYKSWLRSSFDLYPLSTTRLSLEQWFFVSFAQDFCHKLAEEELRDLIYNDEHTPNEFRVIGSLRNLPEFSETFSCPEDSAMNPPDKCELW